MNAGDFFTRRAATSKDNLIFFTAKNQYLLIVFNHFLQLLDRVPGCVKLLMGRWRRRRRRWRRRQLVRAFLQWKKDKMRSSWINPIKTTLDQTARAQPVWPDAKMKICVMFPKSSQTNLKITFLKVPKEVNQIISLQFVRKISLCLSKIAKSGHTGCKLKPNIDEFLWQFEFIKSLASK